jgi:hypothetical protein
LIPNPIRKVLSSMRAHRARALLMGGQACVFYGAAEFSRDTDLAIVADAANLARLRRALDDLQADVIAVPPFELKYLRCGHAIHFRCRHPKALRLRVDLMAKMAGDAFPKLWERRTTIELPDGTRCDLLSPPDLAQAKKTQRDKDWLMEAGVQGDIAFLRGKRVTYWERIGDQYAEWFPGAAPVSR